MSKKPLLQVKKLSKEFPGVKALSDVNLNVEIGQIHVLVGENGAGKSTLIKIVSGIYSLESGNVFFKGKDVNFRSPYEAMKAGIAVIPQELSIVEDLTVAENIFLGREKRKNLMVNRLQTRKEVLNLFEKFDIKINVDSLVSSLSSAEKQMVEIIRAVSLESALLIMDEPTASLSKNEVDKLFEIINHLKAQGIGIIYISHRLKELFEIGDVVTILRDGKLVESLSVSDVVDEDYIVSRMVGRQITSYYNKKDHLVGNPFLQVKSLSRTNKFKDVSFVLNKSEILGIAGLVGSGRTELLETIFGVEQPSEGEMLVNGEKMNFLSPKDAIAKGFGFVPEERRVDGLIVDYNIEDNISLPSLVATKKNGLVNDKWISTAAREQISNLMIKAPSSKTIVKNLSGGNQQKVVIGKWLAADTKFLLLDEPTRGIDVNAKSEIYGLINDFVINGGSVLMVSSELPELLGVCDRILVMREGVLTGEFMANEATEKAIMQKACI